MTRRWSTRGTAKAADGGDSEEADSPELGCECRGCHGEGDDGRDGSEDCGGEVPWSVGYDDAAGPGDEPSEGSDDAELGEYDGPLVARAGDGEEAQGYEEEGDAEEASTGCFQLPADASEESDEHAADRGGGEGAEFEDGVFLEGFPEVDDENDGAGDDQGAGEEDAEEFDGWDFAFFEEGLYEFAPGSARWFFDKWADGGGWQFRFRGGRGGGFWCRLWSGAGCCDLWRLGLSWCGCWFDGFGDGSDRWFLGGFLSRCFFLVGLDYDCFDRGLGSRFGGRHGQGALALQDAFFRFQLKQ